MIKTAVILAAGSGTKLWPYATIRPKAMVPICTRPLVALLAESLFAAGIERVHIAANDTWASQLRGCFLGDDRVTVTAVGETRGSAETLLRMRDIVDDDVVGDVVVNGDVAENEAFLVLYGDVLLAPETVRAFVERAQEQAPLVLAVQSEGDDTRDRLSLRVNDEGHVAEVVGHPRGGGGYWFGGFAFTREVFPLLEANPGYFRNVEVGMMSPRESYLEMSVAELAQRQPIPVLPCAPEQAIDIDRPWDIMIANRVMAARMCAALTENVLAEGATIDPTAQIKGHVVLGKNSRIGRNVVIEGNCIVGDDTRIDNGAILLGGNIIGDRCTVTNYCYVDGGAVVGHDCVLNHCAEFGGLLFDGVFLYHYMELFGIIGEHTDIGAGTACGTLRFDDGVTTIRVKGRPERPRHFSNATYLGDFCRTGVNVTIAPGKRIGCYSVIGAGTIVQKDVPERTLIHVKQELVERPWGPERYGW